jgi:esterase/lipase superfamily enzyme
MGLALLLAGCVGDPIPSVEPPTRLAVYFGTDRAAFAATDLEDRYGAERGPLAYGLAEVSIPGGHEAGQIESPSLISFEFSEQADRHVVLQGIQPAPRAEFLAALQRNIRETDNESVFIFVHGYNVAFAEALRRTAQIAHDLDWRGTAILYSWPSHADTGSYGGDRENALWATRDLQAFIETVAVYSDAAKVHLIAHSMGNEPTLAALARLAQSTGFAGVPLLDEVVLAAPDVAADEFTAKIAQAAPTARRFTLYVSANDTALYASSFVNDKPRAGDSSGGVLVLPGVDTIDASAADSDLVGHSYYGESRAILADVFALLKTGSPADRRAGLRAAQNDAGGYWVLAP